MKKIFLLLLSLFPITGFCQIIDSTKEKKVEIGITYSPEYSYRTLKPEASNKWIADIRDTLEIPKYGYTTGLNVIFKLTKNISLGSGILFSDKGEKTKKYSLNNPSAGNLPLNNTFIYHDLYLDLPLEINYSFLSKKINCFFTAGISTNIFLLQKTTSVLEYSGSNSEKKNATTNPGFSKINFSFLAGFGIDCPIASRTYLKIEPVYIRSINSIIDAPIKSYLYSAGLNIGIFYKL